MAGQDFIDRVNNLSRIGCPFLFLIDFEMEKPIICKFSDLNQHGIRFDINGIRNYCIQDKPHPRSLSVDTSPMNKDHYLEAFELVQQHIHRGNTYLLNLTFPTPLSINLELEDIFHFAEAPYKLYHPEFTVFSPECFVKISNGKIYSFPMKGTIDASVPNAEVAILQNNKEKWEHNTIVDLIRNDLSMVSNQVEVHNFRHLSRIKTHQGELLQVSSTITGTLPDDWKDQLGNIIIKLLPAGSISGAPKKKTIEIIHEVESGKRGYYTGIFGCFDGSNLDSAVMIRYIEKTQEGFLFRSGGGITALSDAEEEFQELLAKVYVPII